MHAQPAFVSRRNGAAANLRRIDSTDAQLYSTDFAPLQEGQLARLLLQPGRGNDLVPGMLVIWRGTRLEYRLRIEAYLPERGASTRRKSGGGARSNRMSVRVESIGARTPDEPAPCTVCKGSGAVELPGVCPECNGHAHGCADCDGVGRIDWSECSACHGRGRTVAG